MQNFNQTRSFNLGVALETSLEAAIIYDDFAYAQQLVGEGKWFYRSYEKLLERLPFLSERTAHRKINELLAKGYISRIKRLIEGKPICHYRITATLAMEPANVAGSDSAKMAGSIETAKMAGSYKRNRNYKETIKDTRSGASATDPVSSLGDGKPFAGVVKDTTLLRSLIEIVNPTEKPTQERQRLLNARLKDYTKEEITAAATVFSKSAWHKQNHQMSIDNLLAPSKFGRWHNAATADVGTGYSRDENGHKLFDGELITHENHERFAKIYEERMKKKREAEGK